MRALLLGVVASLAGCVIPVDPCDGVPGTCLAVHVDSPDLDQLDQLTVRARGSGVDAERSTRSAGGTPVTLPTAVALLFPDVPDGVSLSLDLQVSAELAGQLAGGGVGAASVDAGQHASAHVSISSHELPDGGDLSIQITSPTPNGNLLGSPATFTNGNLTIEIATDPPLVDQVTLEIDGVVRASWPGQSPFRFDWDTTSESQGVHSVWAHASVGSRTVDAPSLVTVEVDRQGPMLAGFSPDNQTSADLLQPFEVFFDEDVAPGSLYGIILTTGNDMELPIDLVVRPRSVTVVPKALPQLPADLVLFVPKTVTDLAGNPFGDGLTLDYRAPAWLQTGNDVGTSVTRMLLAPLPPSRLVASIGTSDDQGLTTLHVKQFDGSSWLEYGAGYTPLTTVGSMVDAEGLAVAVDPLLLYRSRPDSQPTTISTHQVIHWDTSTQSWKPLGPPVLVGNGGCALAADSSQIVVAYVANDVNNAPSLFAVRWDAATGSWKSLGPPVNHGSGGVDSPSLALMPSGDVVVAFRERALGSLSAFAGVFHQGQYQELGQGTSAALDGFPGVGGGVGIPVLAVDHAGRVLVAFSQDDGTNPRNLYVYRWETSFWTSLLAGQPSDVGTAVSLAVDQNDRPIALYHDNAVKASGWVVRWDDTAKGWAPLGLGAAAIGLQHPLVVDFNNRANLGVAATGRVLRANQ
jgi:hypothetical protein